MRNYQTRIGGLVSIDLDYTHNLTDRLAVVGSLSRAIGGRVLVVERFAPAFRERSLSQLYAPLVRISLNYRLGRAKG